MGKTIRTYKRGLAMPEHAHKRYDCLFCSRQDHRCHSDTPNRHHRASAKVCKTVRHHQQKAQRNVEQYHIMEEQLYWMYNDVAE